MGASLIRATLLAAVLLLAACLPRAGGASPAPSATPARTATPAATSTAAHPLDVRRMEMLDDVKAALWPERHPKFAPATPEEREALSTLIGKMTKAAATGGAEDAAWGALAKRAGMRVEAWERGGETFWAILEEEGKHRGAGAYLLRVGPAAKGSTERILEAPHVFHDLRTGEIAVPLFFDPPATKPRALFVNTVHRYQDSKDARDRTYANPADVCHNPDHLFTAATLAAAAALGTVEVVELHGFGSDDPEARGSALPRGTSMVVSGGREGEATPLARTVAAALKKDFDAHVLLYPDDTTALGATRNVQGIGLREIPGAAFLHVEMSRALRDSLATDAARREAFGRVVLK